MIYEVVTWPGRRVVSRHRSLAAASKAIGKKPSGKRYKYRVRNKDGKYFF